MSLWDSLVAQVGNVDIAGMAAKVGLSPDLLKTGADAILGRMTGGEAAEPAVEGAAADTGISLSSLMAFLPMLLPLLSKIDLSSLLSNPGGITSMLDRDGDGAVLDDLGDMAKGLFGGKA